MPDKPRDIQIPDTKYRIRNILLQHNEPYTKLKKWFYSSELLFPIGTQFKTFPEYEMHFNSHIVSSCNTPDADKIKSCRKSTSRITTRKTARKTTKNN